MRSFVIGGRKVDSEGPEAKVEWQGAARDAIESHREVVLRVRDQELRLKCHYPHAKPGFKPKIVPKSKTARISLDTQYFYSLVGSATSVHHLAVYYSNEQPASALCT